jgi:16S rRNA (guanine(527)-N(7))-methyltransferase RsmG
VAQPVDIADIIAYIGWERDDPRASSLELFLDMVRRAPLALVSHRDRDRLATRHLAPSLDALAFLPANGCVLDMGSGAGFPAIPLAVARPDLEFFLVDSTRKKTDFLAACAHALELRNVQTRWDRLESLASKSSFAHRFQLVTARSLAKLPQLLPLARAFVAPDGKVLLWKGRNWRREGDPTHFGFICEQEIELSDGSVLILLSPEDKGTSTDSATGGRG